MFPSTAPRTTIHRPFSNNDFQNSRANSSPRNVNVEILRIIAAFGIVAYHANVPFKDIPYAGLIVFLALSPLVDTKFGWLKVRPVSSLAKVLLVPWAFWFVVYAAANLIMHKPLLPEGPSVASLLYGSSPHLWFLPFMFAVLVAIGLLKKAHPTTHLFWISAIATSAILVTSPHWRPLAMTFPAPYAQWLHALAAAFAGLALGVYRNTIKFAWLGFALIGIALVVCAAYQLDGMSSTYPIGILLVAMAMVAPDSFSAHSKTIRAISECMFGVYLVHILGIAIVNKITPASNYGTVIVIFSACLLGVFITRRLIPSTKIVLG